MAGRRSSPSPVTAAVRRLVYCLASCRQPRRWGPRPTPHHRTGLHARSGTEGGRSGGERGEEGGRAEGEQRGEGRGSNGPETVGRAPRPATLTPDCSLPKPPHTPSPLCRPSPQAAEAELGRSFRSRCLQSNSVDGDLDFNLQQLLGIERAPPTPAPPEKDKPRERTWAICGRGPVGSWAGARAICGAQPSPPRKLLEITLHRGALTL